MKHFFVIKGEPQRWFDQQGKELGIYDGRLPDLRKTKMEDAVNVGWDIDNVDNVPTIIVSFVVRICQTIEEVNYYAKQQNDQI